MKTMKRLLTLLLALTLVLGMAVPVFAADIVASGTCGENVTWTLDSEGTLTISGTGPMTNYNYDNPAPWFNYKEQITAAIIEDGITTIGDRSFYNCNSFTSITIPNGVTTIGSYAFYSCKNLSNITIPDSVTTIGDHSFILCTSLSNITIPNGVTTIGDYAFNYCKSLTSVTIPDSVTTIGDFVFSSCKALLGIWVDKNNKFYSSDDCGVLFNKDKTRLLIAPRAISGGYEIPNSVTTIFSHAFSDCDGLTSITIPNSVTYIGGSVFSDCDGLTSITIPDSVTHIDSIAFQKCDALNGIWVNENNKFFSSDDRGVFFNKDKTTLIAAPCAISGEYAIPDSVTAIDEYAFYECRYLTSITIPNKVISIEGVAFMYCSSLTEIIFTGDAPSIDNYTFPKVTATAYYPADNATWTEDVRQNYGGNLTWVGYTKANPYKITNVVSGIHVYWKAVSGTAKYGLWRSETGINGTYKWVANPTVPHFTDTKVESGKTYYYKVTTMDSKGNHSIKSDAIGITYVSTPDISARYNKAAGVKLDWKKVTGATGYAIYRKSYSGSDAWVRVATISGNATFTWTDTSVKNNNGTAYKYTIRALAGSDMKTLSGCRNAGRSMVRLTSRTLTGASKASATSIKCSWNTSSAVTGYEVRFIVDGVVYKTFTVGDYKVGTKTFTGLKAGQTYKIQVRSYKKIDGMGFYSAWSTAKNVTL